MDGEWLERNTEDSEEQVERLKWMLTGKPPTEAGRLGATDRQTLSYGDPTSLNASRLILDSVGDSLLRNIVEAFADLLGASCQVYEKNGDHALNIFSSSWCRFMDEASRRHCDTPDNRVAMECGHWHCHESCWKGAALRSIETEAPVDVACRGGIRVFAIPICAGREVIGSISVGYGDPPRDPATLSELAAIYGVSASDLRMKAEACHMRPPFIIATAKEYILSAARIIGEIVERKQAEQVLRKSQEKFRALFEFAKDAVFVMDLDGHILDANREACERLGYSHEEFLKMGVIDVDTSEQAALLPERIETLRRQDHLIFETLHQRRDGTLVPVEISARLFESAGKQLVLGLCRDIRERKKAESALAESEKRFSVFMEHLPAGVFIKDQAGRLQFANRYLKELFGWQECVGKTTEALVPQEFAGRMTADDLKALTEGPMVIQERITDIHGAELFFDTYKFPIEAEGVPSLLGGIAVDITKHKLAEAQISQLNALRERLLGEDALNEKVRIITEAAVHIHDADFARIWITKEGDFCETGCSHARVTEGPHVCRDRTRCLHLVASSGRYTHLDGKHRRVPLGAYKIGRIASGKHSFFLTNDVTQDPAVHDHDWAGSLGLVSFAGFRLISPDGNPIGVLALFKRKPIASEEMKFLEDLANTASQVIQAGMTEEALRESENRFRSLVLNSSDTITVLAADGTIKYQSPSLKRFFGYEPAELTGKSAFSYVHPDDLASTQAAMSQILENPRRSVSLEYRFRHADGFWVFVESVGSSFLDDPGIKGMVLNSRDITERKRMEEALEKRIVALTQPLDDVEGIAFEDLFNLSDLQRLQDVFAKVWGVAALITRPDGTPITQPSNFTLFCGEFIRKNEKGFRNCQKSDATLGRHNPSGPIIHECLSAGLWGAGASITVGGRHIASWLIGQVRNEAQSEERIREYARVIGADEAAFRDAFLKVPVMDQKTFEQIAHSLFALANQLSTLAYQNIQQARFIAERKRVEEALRESERRLSEAQRIAQLGQWSWDVRTGHVEWSEEVFRIFQLDPNAFTPQIDSILALSPWPEDHKRDKELIRKAIESHERGTFEQRFLRPDNSIGHYVSSFQGKYDDNGDLVAMVGTVQDISERKAAEERLEQSEEKFRGIYEESPIGIELYDREGTLLDANTACLNIFGISERTAVKGFNLFEDPNLSEELKAQLRRGESVHYEIPFDFERVRALRLYETSKSGTIHLDALITPLRDVTKDSVNGYLVHLQDITERKRAEGALLESEARYSAVVRQAQDGVLIIQDDMLQFANQSLGDILGYAPGEMENTPYLNYVAPESRAMIAERVKERLEGNEVPQLYEAKLIRKDGTIIDAEISGSVIQYHGRIADVGIIRDITERKRAEEERRKLEDQMREVQKLESLGVLAGGIAHDFNNLLMAILGNADLADLSLSPVSPARIHIEEIILASQRAADLCRQMLAYSGKGRFVVSRYDISEIVREMGQMLDVSISKKAMMRYSLAEGLPAVEADATQIRQVIMNLITNASEALGDERGVITVVTGVMECDETYLSESYLDDGLPGGQFIVLEVSDTGCGMDAEARKRIFDPFFTTKFTGRGLGLAAVLGIVRGHKGAIKVYSEVGRGTTFKVLLPAVEWEPGERVRTDGASEPLKGEGTILLVDDDPVVLRVASAMLAHLGYQVLTASNGLEGLKVFRIHEAEITCVILDLMMPEMGGEETFRELRALRNDMPVILSSGYNEQDVTQRFVGRGLTGFIQKPYTVANLRSALNRALD